jgi:AraC family transcriptional regulator
MDESLLSASRFAAVLPAPPLASAAWSICALHVVESPTRFVGTFADHVLTLQLSGRFRARQDVNGRSVEGWCGAGCVGISPANVETTWETHRHSGTSRATSVFIPEAFVSRAAAQDWDIDPQRVEIIRQFLVRDPVIEGVLTNLVIEARHEAPSGLYAESACAFLAHHVMRRYSSVSTVPRRARGGLTGRHLTLVVDYIHDNLAQSITLHALADLVSLSPRHFERAFRQACGLPPHTYVTNKRVSLARQLLLDRPHLTIDEIAARVGFSSSSHLAAIFRRHIGCSPTTFRRNHQH